MNDVDEYNYDLPRELIAQQPLPDRDSSRLMVVSRHFRRLIDTQFSRLDEYLQPGDVLVANKSRVIPARLHGRLDTGGAIELLLVRRCGEDGLQQGASEAHVWEVMARPARKLKPGRGVMLPEGVVARVVEAGHEGRRIMRFEGAADFRQWLARAGRLPIPPYIKQYPDDPGRYQTIYAETEGSVAAPTAGLHFTSDIFERLQRKGVEIHFVTLHVGPGTFKTVDVDHIDEIRLEPEWGGIDEAVAKAIMQAKADRRRVIAVGTTTTRLLEGLYRAEGAIVPWSGEIDVLIRPPFEFQVIDALITNFHLPRSTLLMLVSAVGGRDLIRQAYAHAIDQRYRFYSFGDAMFIC